VSACQKITNDGLTRSGTGYLATVGVKELNKNIRRSCLPVDFKSLNELSDSADQALFRVIAHSPLHAVGLLHPLLPPRKRTVYNLR